MILSNTGHLREKNFFSNLIKRKERNIRFYSNMKVVYMFHGWFKNRGPRERPLTENGGLYYNVYMFYKYNDWIKIVIGKHLLLRSAWSRSHRSWGGEGGVRTRGPWDVCTESPCDVHGHTRTAILCILCVFSTMGSQEYITSIHYESVKCKNCTGMSYGPVRMLQGLWKTIGLRKPTVTSHSCACRSWKDLEAI